jgi:hypothetical protein
VLALAGLMLCSAMLIRLGSSIDWGFSIVLALRLNVEFWKSSLGEGLGCPAYS